VWISFPNKTTQDTERAPCLQWLSLPHDKKESYSRHQPKGELVLVSRFLTTTRWYAQSAMITTSLRCPVHLLSAPSHSSLFAATPPCLLFDGASAQLEAEHICLHILRSHPTPLLHLIAASQPGIGTFVTSTQVGNVLCGQTGERGPEAVV
jgi:hypothetical protein